MMEQNEGRDERINSQQAVRMLTKFDMYKHTKCSEPSSNPTS